MSAKINNWLGFAVRVRNHIRDYVLPQYGDNTAPDLAYTADDCIKHAQRYLARFGRQSRDGEELLDLMKAAHWIQIAHDKLAEGYRLPDPHPKQIAEVENYADHPKSISEVKSDKAKNGALWTPRDAIIDLLRDIDSGKEKPSDIVICFREVVDVDNGKVRTGFRNAAKDYHVSLGLLDAVRYRIQSE